MYYYSQEARCYALLILFSAVAFVLWLRALEDRDTRSLALWAGASILALLTHYFAAFLFIRRRSSSPGALACGALLPVVRWCSSVWPFYRSR